MKCVFLLIIAFGLAGPALSLAPTASAEPPAGCAPTWQAFGSPGFDQTTRALAMFDDGRGGGLALYVGGQFVNSGATQLNGIARWSGNAWQSVGEGVTGTGFQVGVHAMAVFDDGNGGGPALYAGGRFVTAGGVAADGIARWDGNTWSPVGTGQMSPANSIVNALVVHDDGHGPALYAGGSFTSIGGTPALRVARWDGKQWAQVGNGIASSVYALASFDDGKGQGAVLVAGGIFVNAGGSPAIEVARWDSNGWAAMDHGLGGVGVYALAVYDDGLGAGPTLFAGGAFTSSGPQTVARIARWTGSAWANVSANGIGANSGVYSLAVFDDATGAGPALYAGGDFTSIGGSPASCVARWNGLAWSALGAGVSSTVFELLGVPSAGGAAAGLYVGGAFLTADGGAANCIARWEGCVAESCLNADLNCDGIVDGADLGALLAAWGPCNACTADLNGDGNVDGADLGQLLADWTI